MSPAATTTTPDRYQAIGPHNVTATLQWQRLAPELREAVEVVSQVLPFRTNRYLMEHLIDWTNAPDDPIFQLVFPQREMLPSDQYRELLTLQKTNSREQLARLIQRIRLDLNPHPAGQLTHNVPVREGRPLWGLQHKYRETVLFFPFEGQSCHAYCTYCFRWAQFVGMEGIRFASKSTADLVAYLKEHPEVSDVLITGGDPMIMRTSLLRKYLEPLLVRELDHVQNIRIGTKALASWPQRFVSDPDADECLRLFEEVAEANRHLAIMAHYSHPKELEPQMAREAIRRVRGTGAQIRMQAPLIRRVNDDPSVWASLWRTGVRLGLIPYYMFIERDTGASDYFEVPLLRAYEIYREAYSSVSGLCHTVQGPSMSALPGKVKILGVTSMKELHERAQWGAFQPQRENQVIAVDDPVLICDFIQARDPSLIGKVFFARLDPRATWFDQLRPVFGRDKFHFESSEHREEQAPAYTVTESLLN